MRSPYHYDTFFGLKCGLITEVFLCLFMHILHKLSFSRCLTLLKNKKMQVSISILYRTDCYHSTSDVLFMIDSSSDVDWLKYSEQITALHVMLRAIPVGVDDVHVSLAKFADDVVEVCSFDEHFTTTNLRVELNGVSRMNTEGNITKALQHARMTGFLVSSGARSDTRKFVILVTSRDFSEDIAEIKVEAENLKESGVTLVTVAIDAETADHYLDIATDPAFVYILGNEVRTPHNVLYTLVGSLDYDVCESD